MQTFLSSDYRSISSSSSLRNSLRLAVSLFVFAAGSVSYTKRTTGSLPLPATDSTTFLRHGSSITILPHRRCDMSLYSLHNLTRLRPHSHHLPRLARRQPPHQRLRRGSPRPRRRRQQLLPLRHAMDVSMYVSRSILHTHPHPLYPPLPTPCAPPH